MRGLIRLVFVFVLVSLPLVLLPFIAEADEPIVGEIRMFAGSDEEIPDGWLAATGSCVPISSYPELTTVISTTYGDCGDASTFIALPDFKGVFPVGYGPLGPYQEWQLGDTGGEYEHTLTIDEMPSHDHGLRGRITLPGAGGPYFTFNDNWSSTNSTNTEGGGFPHNNIPPYLVVHFIIFTGVYLAGTPTPTPTSTPTPDPQIIEPYVYTHTLQSGHLLTVPVQATFGQLIIAAVVLALVSVGVIWLIFVMVYRR